jgi:hypothetical protein
MPISRKPAHVPVFDALFVGVVFETAMMVQEKNQESLYDRQIF